MSREQREERKLRMRLCKAADNYNEHLMRERYRKTEIERARDGHRRAKKNINQLEQLRTAAIRYSPENEREKV